MFEIFKARLRKSLGALSSSMTHLVGKPVDASAARPVPATASRGGGRLTQSELKVDDGRLHLPLRAILSQLKPELKERIRDLTPDEDIAIPSALVIPQLARGIVKLSFGELRQAAPKIFSQETDLDKLPVTLPLSEVVARVDPKLIQRQRAQKRLEVPRDMVSPFDASGNRAAAAADKNVEPEVVAAKPVASEPLPPPSGPGAGLKMFQTAAEEPTSVSPCPLPTAEPSVQPNEKEETDHSASGLPISPALPAPAVLASHNGPAVAVSTDRHFLNIQLAAVCHSWPEAVRGEITQMGLGLATIQLPVDVAKQGLKRGALAYSWKIIREWISPAAASAASTEDAVVVTFPLGLIAPVFLTLQAGSAKRQKPVLDESIPDLFQMGSSAEARTPEPPAPNRARVNGATPTASISGFREVAPLARPDPLVQYAPFTPDEIVSRATAMKGVAGALVALLDGLPVANRLPSGVKVEALAAFVPSIYHKVGASMTEFQIGELTRLRFDAEDVPWEIIRVGKVFFAAYGRVGEHFPEEELTTLASGMEGNS